ncbi:hypothetical protein Tco_1238668 [Tanacetum coccineum]
MMRRLPLRISLMLVTDLETEEDSEDGPVDYPADGGDGVGLMDSMRRGVKREASKEEEFVEEEQEHLAFEPHLRPISLEATPPSPTAHVVPLARISIRAKAPMPFPSEEEVERLLALPPPPPSPLISLSPPSVEERLARCLAAPALPSSPLPIVLHLYGSPNMCAAPPGLELPMGKIESLSPSTTIHYHHYHLHLITTFPPHWRPLQGELPPRKRLGLIALTSRYIRWGRVRLLAPRPTGGHGIDYGFIGTLDAETRRQRAEEVGYGIRDTWVDPREAAEEIALVTLERGQHRVSSLQGHLAMTLGEIRALQARDQARTDAPEGTGNHAVLLDAAPMTAATVEQLIEARVSAALANHETLRNITNGHGDGSHNSGIWKQRNYTHSAYTLRFQEACHMITDVWTYVSEESDEVEQKRKLDLNPALLGTIRVVYQQQNKRQNTRRAYTAGPGEKREYTGSLPLCTKCNYHHKGPCAPRCNKCKSLPQYFHASNIINLYSIRTLEVHSDFFEGQRILVFPSQVLVESTLLLCSPRQYDSPCNSFLIIDSAIVGSLALPKYFNSAKISTNDSSKIGSSSLIS